MAVHQQLFNNHYKHALWVLWAHHKPMRVWICEFSLPKERSHLWFHNLVQFLHQSAESYSTSLTKVCLPSIAPLKTFMINTSFTTGIVPHSLKTAIVRPTLKRLVLDPEDLNNYRATSNLQFISKVLERIVASQFQDHPENNQPHSRTQLKHFFLTPLTKFPGQFWHSWKFSYLAFVLS